MLAFLPSSLGTSFELDAVALEILLNVVDQGEVGIARSGVERHQATQHFDWFDDLSGQ